jgi:hypothetical protein
MTDWLLQTALDAIVDHDPEMGSWRTTKLEEYKDCKRLDSLFFLCCSLVPENQAIVASHLGIDPEDLIACGRVLQRI